MPELEQKIAELLEKAQIPNKYNAFRALLEHLNAREQEQLFLRLFQADPWFMDIVVLEKG